MSDDEPPPWNHGEWGFCSYCKFEVPLTPDGTLIVHSAGKYAPYAACARENQMPEPMPFRGIIAAIATMDETVASRIRTINDVDPVED